MSKNRILAVIVVLSITLLPIPEKAASICVIDEIKLRELQGVVLLPNKIPIPDAVLVLYERGNERRKIAEIKADENGRFKFTKVKTGKYVITASYPTLITRYVPVRVTSSQSHQHKEVVITLNGLIGELCGGGSVDSRRAK
ncbi:MAG TPA: carboxypeptidase-like regulatory domain-containing protein [Pyrinomonadaceae bacterium]